MEKKEKDLCFLININNKIFFKDSQEAILNFEIKRLKFFFDCSIWLIDYEKKINQKSKYFKNVLNNFKKIEKVIENLSTQTHVFVIESINPIIDSKLIDKMNLALNENEKVIPVGAIPGTAPEIGLKKKIVIDYLKNENKNKSKKIYFDSQRLYNNQFNLERPLRIKLFLGLLNKNENFYKFTITDFIKMLEKKEYFNYLLDYCEKINATELKKCLNCMNKELKPIYFETSQPALGFIPSSVPIYLECMDCGLVFLRRQCHPDDLSKFYDEFERPKIDVEKQINDFVKGKNGTHLKEKMKSIKLIESKVSGKIKLADFGAGFGEFGCVVKSRNPNWDVYCIDFNLDHVKKLIRKKKVKSINMNFLKDFTDIKFDVITAFHVIEHIPFSKLQSFFKNIHKSLNDDGYLLISTPNYESPLGAFFDYNLVFPPVHQTILSSNTIEEFLKKKKLFVKITESSSSVILENYDNWFSYFYKSAPYDELKKTVEICNIIKNDKNFFEKFEEMFNEKNLGSELIMLFKKK